MKCHSIRNQHVDIPSPHGQSRGRPREPPMWTRALLFVLFSAGPALTAPTGSLPGTKPLEWDDDLAVRMMDGLHRFVERKIESSVGRRLEYWKREFASREAY